VKLVHNPAKLAELIVIALRARDIDAVGVDGENPGCRSAAFAVWSNSDGVVIDDDACKFHELTMPQARRILAAIMATPADVSSREQCERLIKGEP
jgi:hypothetical protein